ncbi:DnaJ-class molecular chaperone [Kitasatospora gansuensis]|uniref:DnaJ-class molecular chaperone n=1 Tax=Kitasatospora gansuensis TaxID=258050 RepID=A0A7W7SDX1_9ACTN|nr:hypothetical protein [Kitasatospora gansuensis]MBB4948650.1 DnaJ-class molecular chaperone [Kitasatospora gansuensis]
MMPQQHPLNPRRICRDCHGFGRAHIATGSTRSDGTRDTLPVNCQSCQGLGTSPLRLATSRA